MKIGVTALERAFQLARSGSARVSEIKKKLHIEGYDTKSVDGPQLHRQLRTLIAAAAPGQPSTVTDPELKT